MLPQVFFNDSDVFNRDSIVLLGCNLFVYFAEHDLEQNL